MLQAPYNKHIFVFTFKNLYDVDTLKTAGY